MLYPVVVKGNSGVYAILPYLSTLFPPAHYTRQEPRVMETVCMRASTVALTGVFGHVIVSGAEHDGSDPGAAALFTLRLVRERNLNLLQRLGCGSEEAGSAPAADCGWRRNLDQGLSESPGPYTDGPHCRGEVDGGAEVQQGDVVVV